MERKPKLGFDALLPVGIIFAAMGGIFLVLGIILAAELYGTEVWMLGLIFAGIGLLFFLIGAGFLLCIWAKYRRAAALLNSGRYIWGQITEFLPNYSITINGRHPYMAIVRCKDASGTTHIFKSHCFRNYPDPAAVGRSVKVYIRDESCTPYYVDLENTLPETILH